MFIVQSMPSFAFHIPVEELDILHVEELQSSYTDYSYAVFFLRSISEEVCLEPGTNKMINNVSCQSLEWEATLILIKRYNEGLFCNCIDIFWPCSAWAISN